MDHYKVENPPKNLSCFVTAVTTKVWESNKCLKKKKLQCGVLANKIQYLGVILVEKMSWNYILRIILIKK